MMFFFQKGLLFNKKKDVPPEAVLVCDTSSFSVILKTIIPFKKCSIILLEIKAYTKFNCERANVCTCHHGAIFRLCLVACHQVGA